MKALQTVEKIRNERRLGSTALAYMVLEAYRALAAESKDIASDIANLSRQIEQARPAMPLIARFSREVVKRVSVFSPEKLLAAVEEVEKTYQAMLETVVSRAAEALKPYAKIATLSHSGTVSMVLRSMKKLELVCVLESRPVREGLILASELEGHVKVKVFVDAAMAYAVREVDAVVVGADALFTDGSFAGKVGVKPLALIAQNLSKPFYVVCDTWKHSSQFVNEYGPSDEISDKHSAENPVFEKTEPELVTAFLTEKKAVSPSGLWALLQNEEG